MASIRREIQTTATPELAWDAIRDVGALHTRLVQGFVADTKLKLGAPIVAFGNGMIDQGMAAMESALDGAAPKVA